MAKYLTHVCRLPQSIESLEKTALWHSSADWSNANRCAVVRIRVGFNRCLCPKTLGLKYNLVCHVKLTADIWLGLKSGSLYMTCTDHHSWNKNWWDLEWIGISWLEFTIIDRCGPMPIQMFQEHPICFSNLKSITFDTLELVQPVGGFTIEKGGDGGHVGVRASEW